MTVSATADRARERLDRGLPELARADDDPAILSYALSGIHGALEAHFRSVLASDPRVPREIRDAALDPGALGFLDVANAMRDYLELPASEHSSILDADRYRHAQSLGDGFAWHRAGLEEYARFVARTLGEPVPFLDQSDVAAPATTGVPLSPPTSASTGTPASLASTRPYRVASGTARGFGLRASHLLLILGGLIVVSLLWMWVESAALDATSRAADSAQVTPLPVSATPSPPPVMAAGAPTPAPVQPTAAATAQGAWFVVGNTDGEGVYLRRTPSMEDRLAPFRDGTRMQVVGPDRESEGRHWKNVRVENGPVGWVPSEYVLAAR